MAAKKVIEIDWDASFDRSVKELAAYNKGELEPARVTVMLSPLEVRKLLKANPRSSQR